LHRPCRARPPDRSLVAEDRSAGGVRDQTGPDTPGSSPCYPASASPRTPRGAALSRINNSVAVHHAVRMHQQSGQIARQNTSRLLRVNRAQVAELVQQVVEVGPTTEDLQRFIDVISQEVEDPGLEFAQVEAEIRENTPFAGVLQFLSSSQNRTELVAYLGLLLVVIQTVLMLTQKPVVVATPDQVEEIIERVVEQVERDQQPEPPPTTQPDCDQEPDKGQRAQGN
jgi:hypothetical protein